MQQVANQPKREEISNLADLQDQVVDSLVNPSQPNLGLVNQGDSLEKSSGFNEAQLKELNKPESFEPKREKVKGEKHYSSSFERFMNDAVFRNIAISAVNAGLHALATVTNFVGKNNKTLSLLNEITDKSAIFCTKWLAPLSSYGYAAGEAMFKDKKPILSLIKLVPPAFLPVMGDANIDCVYGASTAFNQPYDLVEKRIKQKSENDINYRTHADKENQSLAGNTRLMIKEAKSMFKDFFTLKNHNWKYFWKEGIYLTNCAMILAGSLPMMFFARKDRDSNLAKSLGLVRNIGGIMGDVGFMVGERGNPMKLLIGIMCSIAATADIVKRWVNEDIARVLIHLGASLNVSAYALWNAFNAKKETDVSHAYNAS